MKQNKPKTIEEFTKQIKERKEGKPGIIKKLFLDNPALIFLYVMLIAFLAITVFFLIAVMEEKQNLWILLTALLSIPTILLVLFLGLKKIS